MQNIIKSTLKSAGLNFQILEENEKGSLIKLGIGLKNGNCDAFINVDLEWRACIIAVFCPIKVEENKRRRVAELLNGLNYNLRIGNFELDSESGDIRFRTSQLFHELNEDSELIFRRQMDLCMHSLDNVIPVIMSVVYAGVLPEQALAQFYNRADSSMN